MLGFLAACFWLTREEGYWLVPALAFIVLAALVDILSPQSAARTKADSFGTVPARLKAIAAPLAWALIAFVGTNLIIAGINYGKYGVFQTNELRSRDFLRGYGALTRIKTDSWQRYIPLPKDARARAYSVSPAAKELAPALDGPLGEGWRRTGCASMNIHPCSEVPPGWFLWELRDAVAIAGHYRSARESKTFYGELADQIDAACDRGAIECLSNRATMMPPFRREYLGPALQSGAAITKALFRMGDGEIGSLPSMGSPEGIQFFTDVVSQVQPVDAPILAVRGWSAGRSNTPMIGLRPRIMTSFESSITILPAPDVLRMYPDLKPLRFALETTCPIASCDMTVEEEGAEPMLVPLDRVASGGENRTSHLRLVVDNIFVSNNTKFKKLHHALQTKVATVLAKTYALGAPILGTLAVAGLVFAAFLRRRCPIPVSLLALGWACVVAVASRIALLAYIDATSFPAVSLLYASPASPFVIVFTVIGLYAGWQCKEALPNRLLNRRNREVSNQRPATSASLGSL